MVRVCLVLFLVFASCKRSDSGNHNSTLHIALGSEPTSLDPRTARDLDSMNIVKMVFEGLMRPSKNGGIEFGLIDWMDISKDRMKYVFHLKRSQWSDGSPVVATDFLYGWKSILDPKFPTDIAYYLYPIKNARKVKLGEIPNNELGAYAPDPQTLIVELENPLSYFSDLLLMPPFFPVPEHVATQNPNWAKEGSTLIGNGPFSVQKWVHADQISLKKNAQYWDAKQIDLSQVDLVIAGADTGLRMFEDGKLDWTGSPMSAIPVDAIAHLKSENKLGISPFLATYFLRVNVSEMANGKKNPLQNTTLRRALSLAIDRSAMTEHVLQGGQEPAYTLVPPEMDLKTQGLNIESRFQEAQRLYEEALSSLGPFDPIVLSYYNNERNTVIAQFLQQQWEARLGLKVELQAVEPKIYFQKVSKREFQLATGSWTADYNDPINFLDVFKFKEGSLNNTNWENQTYIDLLNRCELCSESEERKQMLRQAESLLIEEMPIIPIYHFALNYLKGDGVEGVLLSPLGQLDLRYARMEIENPSPRR